MATVTLRELARNTASVIQGVQSSGRPALVTRNGRPVAALLPIDETALEDWLLGQAPAATRVGAEADPDLAAGRTRGADWQRARDAAGDSPDPRPSPAPARLRGSHRGD
ncbi:MAG: type II toxin-antitoxin system Phd/YefM family antitoxin [Candidatus Dormibacteria bacterium]|jgi:prevent-host-death family protein